AEDDELGERRIESAPRALDPVEAERDEGGLAPGEPEGAREEDPVADGPRRGERERNPVLPRCDGDTKKESLKHADHHPSCPLDRARAWIAPLGTVSFPWRRSPVSLGRLFVSEPGPKVDPPPPCSAPSRSSSLRSSSPAPRCPSPRPGATPVS